MSARLPVKRPNQAHSYAYDLLNRLVLGMHPSQTNESYSFDDVGNRTASHQGSSYSYQPFNRLVTANLASFGYDTNGNLILKTDACGTWSYSWDYENRLIQASLSGGVTVSYAYDALGRRIQRTTSAGGTTKFVYDGADVIRDLDGTGATVAEYLNGPGIDNKLRQTTGASTSYFLTDHLGTTRALTDANGNITASLTYDSFGNLISGFTSTRYTYTGREFDEDSGLMYYRAGWSDPEQGRFISEDPIGFGGGVNFYAYVGNNPINSRDPFGLMPQRDCVATGVAIGATVGAVAGGITGVAGVVGGPLVIITSPIGALKGAAVGALAGGLMGAIICSSTDAIPTEKARPKEKCEPEDELERQCMIQWENDNSVCRILPTPAARARCYASANARLGACVARRPLPELDTGQY